MARLEVEGPFCTPLFVSVLHNQKQIFKILLDARADVNFVCSDDDTSVLQAAVVVADLEIAQMLLQAGAKIDHINRSGVSPLSIAASMCDVRMLELLLLNGATVDLANSKGITAIIEAAQVGSEKCVRALLDAGADPSNEMKCVPGFEAPPAQERSEVLKLLVGAGNVDPNIRNRLGVTPLMLANDLAVCKALLQGGASPLSLDSRCNCVLHHAAAKGFGTAVICSLYKAGAIPVLRNEFGETPADIARRKGHHAAAQLLEMLATKYCEREAAVANEQRSAAMPDVETADAELVHEMKAVTVNSCESDETSKKSPAQAEAE